MTDMVLNGAEMAVLNSRLEGAARKMANTLLRTGRSGVLNRAKDFSCCIVTADGDLLASAESLPIHVLSGPDMMARVMKEFHPDLKRGDAFLHNSPYHGCSHAADLTLLAPVVDDAGVHRFTVLAKAHQADIGNSEPTTYMGNARDVYHEGALIFPAVQVQRDYKDIGDIIRLCEMRIRVPEQWRGDYLAMVGAARIGEKELLALGREVGWNKLQAFTRQWFDYSEALMVEAVKAMPSGTVTASSTHDPFPGMPPEGVTVKSVVTIDSDASRITVDLTDNIDCLPCGMNLSEATARTGAMIGIFNSIDHRVPKNAGSFRRIEVKLRRGCIVGIPVHPFSCSAGTTNIADRVANGVQAAIAGLGQGVGMAEVGAVIAPSAGVISGIDARNGKAFVNQIFLAFSGGAAAPKNDAWWSTAHVGNAGLCCIDGVELDELYQPLLVKKRAFLADSEGAGRHSGAPSTYVEFGPLKGEIDVGYVSDGHYNPAKGVCGGQNGGAANQFLVRRDGGKEELAGCALVHVAAGETIIAISTGGGGYGDPATRTPEAVAEDVREGYITPDRARTIYKVAVDAGGILDAAATRRLRGN